MDLLQELRERRVLQYVSGYAVAGWGLVQVVAFLEERFLFSPHLVNLIGLALLLLLPSVAVLAWCHGRPGADRWTRVEKVSIPVNLVAAAVLLGIVFMDKDLGAVVQRIEVRDENGTVTERTIPKSEFRRRAIIYYFDNRGDAADDWLRQGLTMGLSIDIGQDAFLDLVHPVTQAAVLRRAGFPDGLDVPAALQRKVARETHCPQYVTGSFQRGADGLTLDLAFHETQSGKLKATRTVTNTDLFALIDEASLVTRRELGVPEAHLNTQGDVPVAEILTSDLDAYRGFLEGIQLAIHENDWAAAEAPLEAAVTADPTFAEAAFMLYAVRSTLGDREGASAAMAQAIANQYRMSERSQFQAKTVYYYNEEPDPQKLKAVLDMWERLYPNDISCYQMRATFAIFQQDYDTAIGALETILEIDPGQHQVLAQLADLFTEENRFDDAEAVLQRYADANPTELRSYTQLAELYLHFGRLEQARRTLEQAQIVEPGRTTTRCQLAKIDQRLGKYAAAEATLEEVLAAATNDEDRLEALSVLTSIYENQGRYDLALKISERWYELGKSSINPAQLQVLKSMRLARLVLPARADTLLQVMRDLRAVTAPPNDRLVHGYEAAPLIHLGRLSEAEAGLADAVSLMEEYNVEVLRPRLLFYQAQLAVAQGDTAGGLDLIRHATELDPTNQRYQRYLGRLQRLNQQRDAAETTLQAALANSPGHPAPNLEMALLLAERGNPDQARPYLDKALAAWRQADASHPGAIEARRLAERLERVP